MNQAWQRPAAVLSALGLLLALGACGDRVENTEIPQTAQPSVEINRNRDDGTVRIDTAGARADPTSVLGAGGGVASTDVRIANEVGQALSSDPDLAAMPIQVRSRDGVVSLRGKAPHETAREKATVIARNVRDVKTVENRLKIG
jgi:hyperosmotically inducible periplasmic protein